LEPFESSSKQGNGLDANKRTFSPPLGIAAVPITYNPHKPHVKKSKDIIDFEREGACTVCAQGIRNDGRIIAICPHPGCESVSHLSCLSKSFILEESGDGDKYDSRPPTLDTLPLVPVLGTCKGCGGTVRWVDVVKEVTLRMRGASELKKLLREPRKKASDVSSPRKKRSKESNATTRVGSVIAANIEDELDHDDDAEELDGLLDDVDEEDEEDEDDYLDITKNNARFSLPDGLSEDEWRIFDDFGDDDALMSDTSTAHASPERSKFKGNRLDIVIEDSDWDDAIVLD
jgi:structure-specific endonuclease subunit SLX1